MKSGKFTGRADLSILKVNSPHGQESRNNRPADLQQIHSKPDRLLGKKAGSQTGNRPQFNLSVDYSSGFMQVPPRFCRE
jgi:hypothetical protein